jgi:hypothetical protein
LGDPASLAGLVEEVADAWGAAVADKFAYDNAYEFLRDHLPAA